jgi:hypothetical protein
MCHNEKYGKFNIKMHMHNQNRRMGTMEQCNFLKTIQGMISYCEIEIYNKLHDYN